MNNTNKVINFICNECKSDNIVEDAWAEWSEQKQDMVLHSTHGEWWCRDCDAKTEIEQV